MLEDVSKRELDRFQTPAGWGLCWEFGFVGFL